MRLEDDRKLPLGHHLLQYEQMPLGLAATTESRKGNTFGVGLHADNSPRTQLFLILHNTLSCK